MKFTVKKPSIDGLIDVLREIQTEIESFHSMLEASVMARALVDLRINEGDQFLLYLRNLPEKVAEHVQLISGAGTVQQLWRAVTEYYIRSRATGTMERAHAVQGSPIRSKGCFNCGDPGHMQSECEDPEAFSEVFGRSETDFASLLAFWRNQEGFPEVRRSPSGSGCCVGYRKPLIWRVMTWRSTLLPSPIR